ncbi:MAG: TIGR03000 domain-containing protein [Gemmatales bacterium]|nr:TIGR03000 domain-containing protein [Gemmatales bacterium]
MRRGLSAISLLILLATLALHGSAAAPMPTTRIAVQLPSDAKLTINGHPMRQGGSRREFVTAPLEGGKTYTYVIRGTWSEKGQTVVVEREVAFQAGEEIVVQLQAPRLGVRAPRQREFHFTYAATVTGLKPNQRARLWLPVPRSTRHQEVHLESQAVPTGALVKTSTEPKYGNLVMYVEASGDERGEIPVRLTYRIRRSEVLEDARGLQESETLIQPYLRADRRVPIGGQALRLIEGRPLPTHQGHLASLLYDVVNEHMVYSKKGEGWGQGDADWACQSGYGNCTDFHSVFIALARAQGIPAYFEIGFPLPEQRGEGEVAGYHCWAWFQPRGRGWIPVDISEANKVKETRPEMVEYYFGNLTEDRVAFTVGRDLDLVPKQSGPPLNYFIYPYAEVDGQPVSAAQFRRHFRYKDLETGSGR